MNTTPKPAKIVLIASGAVTFLFSFLPFFDPDFGSSENGWSGDAGTLFMATWPALFGLIIAGLTAAVVFGNVALPDRLLSFTWKQVNFVLAFTAVVIMVGYLLGGGFPDVGGVSKGIGFWLMLLGSIGLIVGAVMDLLDTDAGTAPGQTPRGSSTPF